jgi:hypothetical protein
MSINIAGFLGNKPIQIAFLGNTPISFNRNTTIQLPYSFRFDEYSSSLVFASPGSTFDSFTMTSWSMDYGWDDVSAFIRGNGTNFQMSTASLGLYTSESYNNFTNNYTSSTYVEGTMTSGTASISLYNPLNTTSSVFDFNSNEFTVESYINFANDTSGSFPILTRYIPTIPISSSYQLTYNTSGSLKRLQGVLVLDDNTEIVQLSSPLAPSNNTWYHISFTKSATHFRGYFDGTKVLEVATSASLNDSPTFTTRVLGFQKLDDEPYLDVLYQDFRVYNGVAKYTGSSYTPPPSMIFET